MTPHVSSRHRRSAPAESSDHRPHYSSQRQIRMHNGSTSKPARHEQQYSYSTNHPTAEATSAAAAATTTTATSLELTLVGHGRAPDTRVWIKVADLDAREAEMQQAAKQFQIPADRWEGSLLYRQYYQQSLSKLTLDPERDCIERNYSYAMQWEDWLTELLVQFYETGRLNIPDACQGSDLLLLLEYFGILYAPDQLVFASYAAYQRVRAWSDYLTQRAVLADHVVHLLTLVPARGVRVYQLGTVESPSEKLTLLPQRGDTTPVYSWGCDVTDLLSQSHLQPQSLPKSRAIYNLFNMTKENKVAEVLRDDFGVFLQNLLPASDINFSVKMVQVRAGAGAEPYRGKRAVLKMTVEPNRTKSELTHPVDEITTNHQAPLAVQHAVAPSSGKPPLAPSTASADHVYRDLGGAFSLEPPRPTKLNRELRQRSIDPVMAGNPDGFKAPVDEIDHVDTGTVTSALTGPFNMGEISLADEDVRAEALRQEWVQGSLLNRDIDDRMKALLEGEKEMRRMPSPIAEEPEEDKREPGTPETTASVVSESPTIEPPSVDKGCHPWEWFNAVCGGYFDMETPPTRKVRNITEDKVDRKSPVSQNIVTLTEEKVHELPLPPPPKHATVVLAPSPENVPDDEQIMQRQDPSSEKISSHEGVKQRLAQLRLESLPKARPQSMKIKAAVVTAATEVKELPSKRNNGFFHRNRQAKPVSKKTKKTGLLKLFRRGNQ